MGSPEEITRYKKVINQCDNTLREHKGEENRITGQIKKLRKTLDYNTIWMEKKQESQLNNKEQTQKKVPNINSSRRKRL